MHPQAAWLYGAVPEWLTLGPLADVDGLLCREVLGDWSHLPEFDRPPKYVAHGFEAPPMPAHLRTDPDRPPLTQKLPGRDISELCGRHSGACAILFNGPSLAGVDFERIPVPTIGMNRTHRGNPALGGWEPDYLVVIDDVWLRVPTIRDHPGLVNGSLNTGDHGYRATRSLRAKPFSLDLAFDGYVCHTPCTSGHLALQLAVYLGFTRIYCLGFDLGGKHFDGSPGESQHFRLAVAYHKRQIPVLQERGVEVYVCGSPDSIAPFPHAPLSALLEAA